ncbi:MAG: MaoC family dehydratase [Alphaproteobacteria bacterium]|jgi:3-hydroxybutyryl-CoA dehydratase|nr:MaoC family dehydratase [Alphaproteobacteria bacterium]
MVSIYYEDLQVGQSATLEKTVTERDIQMFGDATGDHNPVHFDEAYAQGTLFRGRVAHGVLSIGFISAVIGMQLPGEGTIFVSAKVEFKAPVRIGDTVVTTCTVREIGERRRVVLDCVCAVGDTVVVTGEALVMAPKRPKS